MAVQSSDRAVVLAALVVAVAGFTAGASIYTADWLACTEGRGGVGCREPRNMAAGAFAALAGTAITLVANARK